MPDRNAAQDARGRRFGRTLRLVLIYVVLVAGSLGVYFAFYVDARVEQTAVRNFRALDAASERLEEIIANLHQIAGNVPVGVGLSFADTRSPARAQPEAPRGTGPLKTRQIVLEWVDARCRTSPTYQALSSTLTSINAISDRYLLDFRAIPSAAEFTVQPLSLKPPDTTDPGTADADENVDCEVAIMNSLGNVRPGVVDWCEGAIAAPVQRRLIYGPDGVVVEARDCRRFSQRSPELVRALPHAWDGIVALLDGYGVSVRASLASLAGSVALNVAPLFDQYLIADAQGRVLYSADGGTLRHDGVVGAPATRKSRLDFVNHVNIKELVTETAQKRPSELEENLSLLGLEPDTDGGDLARYGAHSRLETFRVADIQFQAFVHPFDVVGLQVPSAQTDASNTLYMVGIVDSSSLNGESIRLRLSLVASALLALGVLFSLLPLLWLWTGGDRLMLTLRHFVLFAATGLTATILFTLFSLHLVSGMLDHFGFDRALERVNHAIRNDFEAEVEVRLDHLGEAAAAMLQSGEARPRLRITEAALPADAAGRVARQYYCRPDPEDARSATAQALLSRYPAFDLAFLLDRDGVQWQCLTYRLADTRPIDLHFRDYFRRPASGNLWRVPGVAGPPFYLDRITSILDGTTETVLAADPRALCASRGEACAAEGLSQVSAAVVIGRLRSLEDTVVPPHIRFAVVENSTGRTLFHSVGSRSLATNFVRETEANADLLALMDSGHGDFLDLTYYGASVRAFAQPLTDGLPWTLITYRGHELPDTLNIIAVSGSAAYVIGALALLVLLVLLAVFLDRLAVARIPWWEEARHRAVNVQLVRDLLPRLAVISAVALLLVMLGVLLAPALGGFIAVASLSAGPLALGILLGRRIRQARSTAPRNGGEGKGPGSIGHDRAVVLTLLLMALLLLGILPTVAWYHDFRAQLSQGMAEYLRNGSHGAVIGRCERQTTLARRYKARPDDTGPQGAFMFGWTLAPRAPADERPEPQPGEPAECTPYRDGVASLAALQRLIPPHGRHTPHGSHEVLQAVSGFSPLASELATRSAFAGSGGPASPTGVLEALLGGLEPPADALPRAGVRVREVSMLLVTLLVGTLLVWLVTASLSDRVLGMRLSLGMLPPALPDRPPRSWCATSDRPLRACVVHRSERLWERLLNKLLDVLRPADDGTPLTVLKARWDGESILWEPLMEQTPGQAAPSPADAASSLYVVAGLEWFIVNARARDALQSELERLAGTRAGILIWSRILPGTWLATLTERVSGDLASVTEELAMTSRWGRLLGPFDVRRLEDGGAALDERFDETLGTLPGMTVSATQYRQVRHTMLREAHANPELLELAASVVRRVCTTPDPGNGNLSGLALQRFRAAAASHFHTIWAASTRGERLQLLALAKGGFANPSQTVTLTSLANRGLIKPHGLVRLQSEAFGRFIIKDLDHDSLLRWRDHGHGNVWKTIWPPIVLVVVLAVAFFVSSTPEALAPLMAILAASIGAVPVIGSLIRGVKDLQGSQGDG